MPKRADNPLTPEDESLLDEETNPAPLTERDGDGNLTPLVGSGVAQAYPAPTVEEALAAQQSTSGGTRRVRATTNLPGLRWNEEGDLPDDANLSALLAAGLVIDVAAERQEKASAAKAEKAPAKTD